MAKGQMRSNKEAKKPKKDKKDKKGPATSSVSATMSSQKPGAGSSAGKK